ncbi:hypothetical protein J6590_019240 [Homalodisca vitripennis]|nr:hypothetical protein J6590_019240 [Homalodisca vitripennis]
MGGGYYAATGAVGVRPLIHLAVYGVRVRVRNDGTGRLCSSVENSYLKFQSYGASHKAVASSSRNQNAIFRVTTVITIRPLISDRYFAVVLRCAALPRSLDLPNYKTNISLFHSVVL